LARGFKPNPKRRTESDILPGQKESVTTEAPRIVMGRQMDAIEVHLTVVEQKVETHKHVRNDILDFFSTPFWSNIPDKPTSFPPSAHTHTKADITDFAHTHPRGDITDFFASPFWDNIPDKPSTFPPSTHANTHRAGGSDALTGNLDANARVGVMNAGILVGTRRRVNFIAGTNVTLNVTDDATNEKVDVTINAQGGGEPFVTATAPPQVIIAGSYFVLARLTVPTEKPNLKVIAIAVSPFYGTGAMGNARIELFNETDNVSVATWGSGAGPVYVEPNQVFALGGKTVSFRLSHGAPGTQECWGSVSFKLTT
jgi:hypothetical protein